PRPISPPSSPCAISHLLSAIRTCPLTHHPDQPYNEAKLVGPLTRCRTGGLMQAEIRWAAPARPAELTYNRLVEAILDGTFPANSTLPAERELADKLGVTRSTLREALQRLAADGWLDIQQGRRTRVRDIWTEGNLNILAMLVEH